MTGQGGLNSSGYFYGELLLVSVGLSLEVTYHKLCSFVKKGGKTEILTSFSDKNLVFLVIKVYKNIKIILFLFEMLIDHTNYRVS